MPKAGPGLWGAEGLPGTLELPHLATPGSGKQHRLLMNRLGAGHARDIEKLQVQCGNPQHLSAAIRQSWNCVHGELPC